MEKVKPLPWGFWATIGFSLLAFAIFMLIQTAVLAGYSYKQFLLHPEKELLTHITNLSTTGFGMSISFIPAATLATLSLFYFSKLRKPSNPTYYLQLNPINAKQTLFWITIFFLFSILMNAIGEALGRPTPEWMTSSYETAKYLPLFWITLIIAAPIFEETLMRGFLLEGLRHSFLGNHIAIVITASLWAIIHLQYEWFEVGIIFLMGVLLGYARLHTQSLYTPIILHALMNLAATIQIALLLKDSGATT